VVANLVDEDMLLHQRANSLSTLLFGVNALFTKPGQSIAPMIGWRMLTYYDEAATANKLTDAREAGVAEGMRGAQTATHVMFLMWTFVPLLCALAQLLVWTRFDLRGSRLQRAKQYRARLEQKNRERNGENTFTV
jgi:Na+/melibiose symporter-like transporter